ncbi:MAG: peptide-methionine (S)-S-oxide reductase MsrA [Hyphomicrobiaceae bacterium]
MTIRRTLQALALVSLTALSSSALAQQAAPPPDGAGLAVATFAGGCFWCMEEAFEKVEGTVKVVSGYMGGKTPNPTYKQVSAGGTGHAEVVQVTYDPKKVTYQQLLDAFWKNIDPYDAAGQFCDKGDHYRSGIFYHNEEQKALAQATKAKLEKDGPMKKPIGTEVTAAGAFATAEEYHQDYYKKNPIQYYFYKTGCGREARLQAIWGKASTQ